MTQLPLSGAGSEHAPARVLKLTVAYDGTEFHGFAAQPETRTVEGVLREVLSRVRGRLWPSWPPSAAGRDLS